MCGLVLHHRILDEVLYDCDLVAAGELGAPKAVLPGLERKLTALDDLKPELAEEARRVCEREDRVQTAIASLGLERVDDSASHAAGLQLRIDRERTHFAGGGRIEVESTASDQTLTAEDQSEIANVLRHLELGARQHDALSCVSVDQLQQRMDVTHGSFTGGE